MIKTKTRVSRLMLFGIMVCITTVLFTACNHGVTSNGTNRILGTEDYYDRAVIKLPTGETIDGKVESWHKFEDCDLLQVTIDDNTYLVHSSNCILINEGFEEG